MRIEVEENIVCLELVGRWEGYHALQSHEIVRRMWPSADEANCLFYLHVFFQGLKIDRITTTEFGIRM